MSTSSEDFANAIQEYIDKILKLEFSNEARRLVMSGTIDPENCTANLVIKVTLENLADKIRIRPMKQSDYENLKKF